MTSCLMTSFAQSQFPETYNSDSIYSLGLEAFEKQEYENAINHFNAIFRGDPLYDNARYERLLAMTYMGKTNEAKLELDSLYRLDQINSSHDMLLLYGSYLSNDSVYTKALELFYKAEKLIPNSSVLLYNMGLLHYRMKSNQKSIDYLKRAITQNPNHISSHFLLGHICLEMGKVAEGTLALLTYLVIQPTEAKAREVILKLNVKMSQYDVAQSRTIESEKGDDFTELTTILQNQLALNPKYKLKASIDEIYTRHIQAVIEYANGHVIKDGFFENVYLPWMKQIAIRNQTEALTYYLLQEYREELGKKLTSKDKMVDALKQTYLSNDFWLYFGKQKMMHFDKMEEVMIYLKDGWPFMIGRLVNNEYEGAFLQTNKHGLKIAELNFKKSLLHGLQKYYSNDGSLTLEATYKDDLLHGIRKTYYPNGQIHEQETYVEDELDGPFAIYHPNGGIHCQGNYVKGTKEGKYTCWHPDGTKKIEATFRKGLLNGEHKIYNEVGDLISDFTYRDGNPEGTCTEYYDGKAIKSVGVYINGKNTGPIMHYSPNGTLHTELRYDANNITDYLLYYINGKTSEHRTFDANSNFKNIIYFDENGEKYFEEKYTDGKLKSGWQYVKGQTQPKEIKLNSDNYQLKSSEGILIANGQYQKGKKNGLWKYYHSNGVIYLEQEFNNDQLNGTTKEYDITGQLIRKTRIVNDQNHGSLEFYKNGHLSQISYFVENNRIGPYLNLYPDGNKDFEGYLINNNHYHILYSYYREGQLLSTSSNYNNILLSKQLFKPDGTLDLEEEFANLDGVVKTKINNNLLNISTSYKNGTKHGPQIYTDNTGKNLGEYNYANGNLHGKSETYHLTDKKSNEISFYNGLPHGLVKYYDLMGNLRLEYTSIFGEDNGKTYRYYVDGSKMFEYESISDTKHGDMVYYNMQGQTVLLVHYTFGFPSYYKVLVENGKLSDPIGMKPGTSIKIESHYSNGKKAMEISFKSGFLNGRMTIYGIDGKLQNQTNYKNNKVHEERKEYYPSGLVYKKENFIMGEYEGIQEYYDESGKLWMSAEYRNDEVQGDIKIYHQGTLQKTKKINTNILLKEH